MRKKRLWMCAVAAAVLLTACGSAATYESAADTYAGASADGGQIYYGANEAADTYDYEEAAVEEAAAAAEESGGTVRNTYDDAQTGGSADLQETVSKKLIRNVNLSVETTEFDTLLDNVSAEVEMLGGYAENFSISGYVQDGQRTGYMTARIPSDRVDEFLNKVSGQSNVVYHSESVEDVTLQYVDLASRKKALVTERDRLLELMEKAETVTDIIEIESRLSEVNYQIDSMEAQLRTIDNQVSYSTVYLDVCEVKVFTPVAEKGIWERIEDGFGNNVYYLLMDLENMTVGFLISLPYILAWIIGIGAAFLAFRLFVKIYGKRRVKWAEKRRKKQEEKRKKAAEEAQEEDYEIIPAQNNKEENTGEKDGQDGTTV